MQRDIPAGIQIPIPTGADKISYSDTYGGAFGTLLIPYLRGTYSTTVKGDDDARNLLPPPLIREGERVQPNWLYQFLLKPHLIRPQVVLRMPQFNMSPEDALALVNYFTAVEKLTNPNVGTAGSFLTLDQHDDAYWQRKNDSYVKTLSKDQLEKRRKELEPLLKLIVEDQKVALKPDLATAEDALKAAKDALAKAPNDKSAKESQESAEKDLKALKAKMEVPYLGRGVEEQGRVCGRLLPLAAIAFDADLPELPQRGHHGDQERPGPGPRLRPVTAGLDGALAVEPAAHVSLQSSHAGQFSPGKRPGQQGRLLPWNVAGADSGCPRRAAELPSNQHDADQSLLSTGADAGGRKEMNRLRLANHRWTGPAPGGFEHTKRRTRRLGQHQGPGYLGGQGPPRPQADQRDAGPEALPDERAAAGGDLRGRPKDQGGALGHGLAGRRQEAEEPQGEDPDSPVAA